MSLGDGAESLASLASNNGSSLNDLFKLVEGIAVVSMDIPAN
jgi:hypothetical protein